MRIEATSIVWKVEKMLILSETYTYIGPYHIRRRDRIGP